MTLQVRRLKTLPLYRLLFQNSFSKYKKKILEASKLLCLHASAKQLAKAFLCTAILLIKGLNSVS